LEKRSSFLSKLILGLFIVALLMGEYIVLQVLPAAAPVALEPATATSAPQVVYELHPPDIADMVEAVSASVVNIETKVVTQVSNPWMNDPFFQQFFGENIPRPREYTQSGIGTGFIISADGYILTNQHVIANATEIKVIVGDVQNKYDAEVIGQDEELDLAILKISGTFTPIALGDSTAARVGEWVVAIGNPYGLDHTVTVGVISATGRPVNIENRSYKNLLQIDAAINPGNSGGPLLNEAGEVIGINTAVSTQAQGIGFAIPIDTAQQVLDELMTTGKVTRPYMGLSLTDLNEQVAAELNLPDTQGSLIYAVFPDTPAAAADLQSDDVIIRFDNTAVTDTEHLLELIAGKGVGDTISLTVIREGKTIEGISMTLAEKP
jgi:S1-C subfamily serine protease